MSIGIILEGQSYSGKTTLLGNLTKKHDVKVIDEYDVYIGGKDKYPKTPFNTVKNAENNVDFLIEAELRRQKDFANSNLTAIFDRSFFSIILFQKLLSTLGATNAHSYAKTQIDHLLESEKIVIPNFFIWIYCDYETFLSRQNLRYQISSGVLKQKAAFSFYNVEYKNIYDYFNNYGRAFKIDTSSVPIDYDLFQNLPKKLSDSREINNLISVL
jgi:deoxyadenosine/deoxycytidine kinase